jgi:hypothetical protein
MAVFSCFSSFLSINLYFTILSLSQIPIWLLCRYFLSLCLLYVAVCLMLLHKLLSASQFCNFLLRSFMGQSKYRAQNIILFCPWLWCLYSNIFCCVKGKSVPLQAWSGPEGSRKLRFPDFMTTALGGGKVVSLTHRPHLPPGNFPGTHFC